MDFKENDIIISKVDISPYIKKNTKGVILYILKKDKIFLVEFIDKYGNTIGNGMETVYLNQIKKYNGEK